MSYQLHLAKRAERDRDEAFEWYVRNYSEAFAVDWYCGLSRAIRSLADNPERCGFVRENERFPFDVRELLYGKSRKNRHRILFTLTEGSVYVLHIRHTARDELASGDL